MITFLTTFAFAIAIGFTQVNDTCAAEYVYGIRQNPIKEFHEVVPGIYRGGRPGSEGMAALARLGVRTDLNLEDDVEAIHEEIPNAEKYSIRFVSNPFSATRRPSDKKVDEALAMLADPSNYPIFIHCHHGQDRTGMIVGLYRVIHQGWKSKDAYREMKQYGFHPILISLTQYFKAHSGYNDSFVSSKLESESELY